jgi:hypothetical protein
VVKVCQARVLIVSVSRTFTRGTEIKLHLSMLYFPELHFSGISPKVVRNLKLTIFDMVKMVKKYGQKYSSFALEIFIFVKKQV